MATLVGQAQMMRTSVSVIQQLLDEMDSIVRDYHPSVGRTGKTVGDLIQGTSAFPGGSGLWRGTEPFGALPEFFPEDSIMFVAHNFDSKRAHDESKATGGRGSSLYWKILSGYVEDPTQCFFTNALMGLQPESAVGKMPRVPGYEDQCRAFLAKQIEIVAPRLVVALGKDAQKRLSKVIPGAPMLLHPSAWDFRPSATRSERVAEQAERLQTLLG